MDDAKNMSAEDISDILTSPGEKATELTALLTRIAEPEFPRAVAREQCFRVITASPGNRVARLVLARLFYEDGMIEFAVRELGSLASSGKVPPSLTRLFEAIGMKPADTSSSPMGGDISPGGKSEERVVAEVDIEADFMELLTNLDED